MDGGARRWQLVSVGVAGLVGFAAAQAQDDPNDWLVWFFLLVVVVVGGNLLWSLPLTRFLVRSAFDAVGSRRERRAAGRWSVHASRGLNAVNIYVSWPYRPGYISRPPVSELHITVVSPDGGEHSETVTVPPDTHSSFAGVGFSPETPGRYRVRVCDESGAQVSETRFKVGPTGELLETRRQRTRRRVGKFFEAVRAHD